MLLYSRIALSLSKSQALVYPCQIAWWICEYLFLDAHHVAEFRKICWSPTLAIFMGFLLGSLILTPPPSLFRKECGRIKTQWRKMNERTFIPNMKREQIEWQPLEVPKRD